LARWELFCLLLQSVIAIVVLVVVIVVVVGGICHRSALQTITILNATNVSIG